MGNNALCRSWRKVHGPPRWRNTAEMVEKDRGAPGPERCRLQAEGGGRWPAGGLEAMFTDPHLQEHDHAPGVSRGSALHRLRDGP